MEHRRPQPRPAIAKQQSLDVRRLVEEVCGSLEQPLSSAEIETVIDVPHRLSIVADYEMLRSAVRNLIHNAIEAMPSGGLLVVTSYMGRWGLELEIADSGPGLNDDALVRAFEPFYTTKPEAAGLGLAVVKRIAQAHGGDVVASNCPEGGAAFTLRIPQRAMEAAA